MPEVFYPEWVTLQRFSMKIVCIARNYVDHAKELNNAVPTTPVLFLKPDTALLQECFLHA